MIFLQTAVLTDQFFVSTYGDKSRLDYVFFCKRPPLGEAIKRLEKLSSWDPKVGWHSAMAFHKSGHDFVKILKPVLSLSSLFSLRKNVEKKLKKVDI